MDSSKKPNKISEIVRLQQILKKWKKIATTNKTTTTTIKRTSSSSTINSGSKSIKFLKKTLSFSDYSSISSANEVVPKGYLAVCVGKELKRFIIPTEHLGHQAFQILLREAEEEFGFEQEGVLKIPCEVPLFEKILKMVQHKRPEEEPEMFFMHHSGGFNIDNNNNNNKDDEDMNISINGCYSSPDCELTPHSHHPQLCR